MTRASNSLRVKEQISEEKAKSSVKLKTKHLQRRNKVFKMQTEIRKLTNNPTWVTGLVTSEEAPT